MSRELVKQDLEGLSRELRELVATSRAQIARTLNGEIVLLSWNTGHRLRRELLSEGRAEYGAEIVAEAAKALTEFGRRFSRRNLYYMMRFAEVSPDAEILYALRTKLSWTHFRESSSPRRA